MFHTLYVLYRSFSKASLKACDELEGQSRLCTLLCHLAMVDSSQLPPCIRSDPVVDYALSILEGGAKGQEQQHLGGLSRRARAWASMFINNIFGHQEMAKGALTVCWLCVG